MNQVDFDLKSIIGLQRHSQRVMILLFAVSAIFYSLGIKAAALVGMIGLGSLYLATVVKLILISELFRRARLPRLWCLCLALFLVLVSIVITRYVSI